MASSPFERGGGAGPHLFHANYLQGSSEQEVPPAAYNGRVSSLLPGARSACFTRLWAIGVLPQSCSWSRSLCSLAIAVLLSDPFLRYCTPMFDPLNVVLNFFRALIAAWQSGLAGRRAVVVASTSFLTLSIVGQFRFFDLASFTDAVLMRVQSVLGLIAGAVSIGIYAHWRPATPQQEKLEEQIVKAEERARDNPQEVRATWDLARQKLEAYLDKNIAQVQSVFRLSVFVMLVGFALIAIGVALLYRDPREFPSAALLAAAGVCANLISATVLALYRSVGAQAREHVVVLERINAVGMSLSVVEKIEGDRVLQNQATAELVKQLLVLYTPR